MSADIQIRRAESIDDYRACQAAQRLAWGIDDDAYVVPIATMVGAQLHGGLVLGAFLPSGEAAGLSFSFLGRVEGRICLYSQLTGIAPAHQDQGLGGRIKEAQRAIAYSEGVASIVWAFDPLQAGNARFNLDKLGARAIRYIENMYGSRTDVLNAGAATDRLIVEWPTDPVARPERFNGDVKGLPRLIETARRPDGVLTPVVNLSPLAPTVLLEIPDDIPRLRSREPELAERWRQAVRQGFLASFAAGYQATGFHRDDSAGPRRGAYLLQRGTEINT
ncbi:MAG: hypothetical protein ABI353_19180 [Isosphaeraceae bacterium]